MTRYMLDTNIISNLIRNPQGRAAKWIAKVGEDTICTSIVVAAELRYGCAKSGSSCSKLSKIWSARSVLTLTGIDPGVLTRIDPPHAV